jgi:fido (protein-threonine AMPylation protein)
MAGWTTGVFFMANHVSRQTTLSLLRHSTKSLSIAEISQQLNREVPLRTLRRWLAGWVAEEVVSRTGKGRASRYRYVGQASEFTANQPPSFAFLSGLDSDLKTNLLTQIRDLWTHTSTALEGNTLSLGDTHFILEEGLTISGKPVKDHQEVIGHARAIELLYQCLQKPLTQGMLFDLHKAVQAEQVFDIYKPNGDWKNEPNGSYGVGADGSQFFIEYALPVFVPVLMGELINTINALAPDTVKPGNAHVHYAKIHMAIVHIHPFWDGNGRIARLLSNIPLLKAGLPPLVIPREQRRTYIQILASYQVSVGQLNKGTGVWPDLSLLEEFNNFCAACYGQTRKLVTAAFEVQKKRD